MYAVLSNSEEDQILYQKIIKDCVPRLLDWVIEYNIRKQYAPRTTYKVRRKMDRAVLEQLHQHASHRTVSDLHQVFQKSIKSVRRVHKNFVNAKIGIGHYGLN